MPVVPLLHPDFDLLVGTWIADHIPITAGRLIAVLVQRQPAAVFVTCLAAPFDEAASTRNGYLADGVVARLQLGESTLGGIASVGRIVAVLLHLVCLGIAEGEHVVDEFMPNCGLAVIILTIRRIAIAGGQIVGAGIVVVDEVIADDGLAIGKDGQPAIDLDIILVAVVAVVVSA